MFSLSGIVFCAFANLAWSGISPDQRTELGRQRSVLQASDEVRSLQTIEPSPHRADTACCDTDGHDTGDREQSDTASAKGNVNALPDSWRSGADMIAETYGDWTLQCRKTSALAQCSVYRDVNDSIKMEIFPPDRERVTKALLILPFGIQLAQGVTLFVDGKPADQRVPVTTCLSNGCLVPISLAERSADQLLNASELKILSFDNATEQPMEYMIPLNGIRKALNRLIDYTNAN